MRRGREGRGIVCAPFRDKQQDAPREECPGCGQEQYWYDPPAREGLCPACRRRVREREENAMTLQEMSKEYRAQAQVLRGLCPVCGSVFLPDGRTRYCSPACAKKAHRRQQRDHMKKKRGWSVDN